MLERGDQHADQMQRDEPERDEHGAFVQIAEEIVEPWRVGEGLERLDRKSVV